MWDGHVKLVKCAGTQNVSDALTKSLARPAFEKHREYMWGTRVPFSASFSTVDTKIAPVMAYSIQLPMLISSSKFSRRTKCVGDWRFPLPAPTRGEWNNGLFLHERIRLNRVLFPGTTVSVLIPFNKKREGAQRCFIPDLHKHHACWVSRCLLGLPFRWLFGYTQKKPTEIWEDNASCIMMSENPTNRDLKTCRGHRCQGTVSPWPGSRRTCKTCQMCRYSECFGRFD